MFTLIYDILVYSQPIELTDPNTSPNRKRERVGSADVQPLTLYEFILFTTTTYGCLHVERINYSLSLLSHLYLTLTLTLTHSGHIRED